MHLIRISVNFNQVVFDFEVTKLHWVSFEVLVDWATQQALVLPVEEVGVFSFESIFGSVGSPTQSRCSYLCFLHQLVYFSLTQVLFSALVALNSLDHLFQNHPLRIHHHYWFCR
jgi:hypothetical protein